MNFELPSRRELDFQKNALMAATREKVQQITENRGREAPELRPVASKMPCESALKKHHQKIEAHSGNKE